MKAAVVESLGCIRVDTVPDPELISGSMLVRVEACAICGQPGPQLSYYYPGSRILRFHAYCDLLWQEERAR